MEFLSELTQKDTKKYLIYILPLSILALGCLLHFMRGSYSSTDTAVHTWGMDESNQEIINQNSELPIWLIIDPS